MSQNTTTKDRVLHFSNNVEEQLPSLRDWAKQKGAEPQLDKALEYVRTYGGDSEEEWKVMVSLDICYKPEKPILICSVYRRTGPESDVFPYGLKHFITMGMVWFEHENDWSFHS